MHRSRSLWPATALLLAVGLAACGSDDPDQSGTDTDPPAAPTSEDAPEDTSDDTAEGPPPESGSESEDAGMGTAPTVATADSDLGTILVDGEGMTLYLFTQDTPDTSVCFDECLAAWPVLEGEPSAGAGADDSLLGSFTREDGTIQASYDGWPLYYFAQDQAPGDVTGQAVNDVWWVINADGAAVTQAPMESGDDGGGIDY